MKRPICPSTSSFTAEAAAEATYSPVGTFQLEIPRVNLSLIARSSGGNDYRCTCHDFYSSENSQHLRFDIVSDFFQLKTSFCRSR